MSKRDQFAVIKPCFLCMWDSRGRAQHCTKKDWPLWEELVPRKERNVINDPLVDRDRILFPPLHIKLGLIKQFTKALDKDGDCLLTWQAFPGLTIEKLKAGIVDGPQIRQLISDPEFENSMNEVELEVWKVFVLVVKDFLATIRLETTQNLSATYWLLSETSASTWVSRCTSYSHI